MSIRDAIEEFLAQGEAEGWRKRTVTEYRKRLRPMADFLKQRRRKTLRDVTPADLDAYLWSLKERGVRKNTRDKWASTIRSFFRSLAEDGKLLINPARALKLPAADEVELPKPPLEEEEVHELLDTLPRRDVIDLRNRLHLELLYGCALRVQESVALNLKDIDTSRRTLRVRAGKGGKDRLLPVGRGVMGALRDYMALRRTLLRGPDHGALLLARYGKRLGAATFRDWLRKLNRSRPDCKPVHPHLLRHSIAVHLLRGGADIRHVQEFLGHSDLETTKIYLRLVPGRLKDDYDRSMPEINISA